MLTGNFHEHPKGTLPSGRSRGSLRSCRTRIDAGSAASFRVYPRHSSSNSRSAVSSGVLSDRSTLDGAGSSAHSGQIQEIERERERERGERDVSRLEFQKT